nr:hypothetical protein GCM10020093_029330 [Planobispora longispora]
MLSALLVEGGLVELGVQPFVVVAAAAGQPRGLGQPAGHLLQAGPALDRPDRHLVEAVGAFDVVAEAAEQFGGVRQRGQAGPGVRDGPVVGQRQGVVPVVAQPREELDRPDQVLGRVRALLAVLLRPAEGEQGERPVVVGAAGRHPMRVLGELRARSASW